ncbi:LPP20 family lipoprotein [Treponema primitia]|uniref:LPP20 family lipoprotein n=1 Tax=Treponema primitia TaxID=88058 RepID=UPI00397ECA66
MKKCYFLFLVVALAALVGCAGAPPAPAAPYQDPNSPEWLNDFPPEDLLWGVGIAKQSSDALSMSTAEARGRTALARQLSTKVEAMLTDYLRDAGTVGNQTALALQEDVSRQITSLQLNGARPTKRWKAPDGSWWILVEYKLSDAKSALTNVIDSEGARFAEFKAEDALKMLDAQLAKSEKPLKVDN